MPLDIFDEIDLTAEDKVLLSEDFRKIIIEEIKKEIGKIPIDKIIFATVEKSIGNRIKDHEKSKEEVVKEMEKSRQELKTTLSEDKKGITTSLDKLDKKLEVSLTKIKEEEETFMQKIRKKYDDLKNEFLSFNGKQWYQFGGFSPQSNNLNIGDPSAEGAWRIVKEGDDLVFQRFESGVWVTKGTMLAIGSI